MRKQIFSLGALLVLFAGLPLAQAAHTRVTNPNALSVEGLGRGLQYSIQYDHVLNDDMAAGFGVGTASVQESNSNTTIVPAYFNYYFSRDAGSLYATAGATLLTDSDVAKNGTLTTGKIEFGSNAVLPVFGFGYENRGDTGFLFRATGYGVVAKKLYPWLGFSFGYAF